jgi:hypothetical protein
VVVLYALLLAYFAVWTDTHQAPLLFWLLLAGVYSITHGGPSPSATPLRMTGLTR